ncbi:MAG: alpha/beta fold hydrolase [Chloroflexota bacterium]
MATIISADGTRIAFQQSGGGPAVILVDGALAYREYFGGRPLAAALANDFTVFTYDRRGRGESGDTQPYSVEREIEDIAALIAAAGGTAHLYGASSGAAMALRAAVALGEKKVAKLALYEPPYGVRDEDKEGYAQYVRQMAALLADGRRGEALALFLADMLPPDELAGLRQSPQWPLMEAVAPTLTYDNAVLGDGGLPAAEARALTVPTLVLDGDGSLDDFRAAADALVRLLPRARRQTLPAQTHSPAASIVAPALVDFFAS